MDKKSLNFKKNYLVEEILEDHRVIAKSLKRLKKLFNDERYDQEKNNAFLKVLFQFLKIFSFRLESHFKLEENYGIFNNLEKLTPRIIPKVKILYKEHQDVLSQLKQMCEMNSSTSSQEFDKERLKQSFFKLSNQLEKHEVVENKLIIDVFNVDIGPSD